MQAAVYMEVGSIYFYIKCSHICLRWNWAKMRYYFTIIVKLWKEAFPAISEALNFQIFPGKNSRFEPFPLGLALSTLIN